MCKKWKVFIMVFCLIFTMMPMTVMAAAAPDATLTLYYLDKNESGEAAYIDIDTVKYTDNEYGEPVKNGHIIPVFFGDEEKVDISVQNYVPDQITDTKGIIWEINDAGAGQQTIQINKNSLKEDKNVIQVYHYKKVESDPPAVTQGGITITKDITGAAIRTAATFTFDITGPDDYSGSASITGEGNTTLSNLEPGNYTVTERKVDNYEPKQNGQVVPVSAGEVTTVSFVNVYTDPNPPSTTPGSITIKKVIVRNDRQDYTDPDPENPPVFNFTVRLSDAKSYNVNITGAGVATIDNLDPGDYTVTENDNPNDDYDPDTDRIPVQLSAGENEEVVFTNIYGPSARINKTVAVYEGTDKIATAVFDKQLNLSELNKDVIFKIDVTCNSEWNHRQKMASLQDIYEELDITEDLLMMNQDGVLEKATDYYEQFPNRFWIGEGITLYYIDKLTANGTYVNTATLYESYYEPPSIMESLSDSEPIASSSAVVVVNYIPPTDNGGGGSSHSHSYYYVTYDANFPVSTGTSGTVPVDNSKYSKGATVTVKDNSGDLKVGDYTFEGWNTRADGTGTAYDPADTFKISSSVTLYAQWKNGNPLLPDDNGEAAATSEVVPVNQLDDVPKTGNATPFMPMLLLGMLSLAGIALSGRKKSGEPEVK